MNFDYGNILTRTFQITWKHKVFWGILALPILVSLVALPFMFSYLFLFDGNTSDSTNTIFGFVGTSFFILLSIASSILYVLATSAFTLGIIRIERGEGSLNFINLLKDGLEYFWRQLGVYLIVQLSIGLVFTIFFACVFFSTMVTMGIASICLQPIIILVTPLTFLMIGVLENAHTAVVHENLNATDAVKRGLSIIREHIWKYIILTIIIYFGVTIISSFITFPIMLPLFFVVFIAESELSNYLPIFIGIVMCIFFPIMTIFSAISQTLMKTSLALTYLNLTKPTKEQVIHLEETR